MKKKASQTVRCSDVTKHVCAHLEEEMDSPRCRQIKRHLQTCADCTAYLEGLKKTIKLYRNPSIPGVPPAAHKKLFAALKLDS